MAKNNVYILTGTPKENIYAYLRKYFPSDAVGESIILTDGKKITLIVVEQEEDSAVVPEDLSEIESEDGLTKKQKEHYLDYWNACPFCGSEELEADHINAEDDAVWGDVKCLVCGKRWRDIYTLTGVEDI